MTTGTVEHAELGTAPGPRSPVGGVEQVRRLMTEVPGPASLALRARRDEVVPTGVGLTLPAFVARAGSGVLVDVDGNSLLDLGAGIAVVNAGHAHPRVVQAVQEQAASFLHTCFMVTPYEEYVAVAERLGELVPVDGPTKTVLLNSGAEAVENAVKIARHATGRDAVVVFDHAYHGRTNLTMAMTAKANPYKRGFGPFAGEVYRSPMSYPFRDPEGMTGEQAADARDTQHRHPGRRGPGGLRGHRAGPGRGRLRRPRARVPARHRRVVPRERRALRRRRDPDRLRPHR